MNRGRAGFSLAPERRIGLFRGVKTPTPALRILLPLLVLSAGSPIASAQLPNLDDHPWIGYFLGSENRKFTFGLTAVAKGKITPMDSKGEPVADANNLSVTIGIEDIKPDGGTIMRQIKPETLETTDPASADFKTATFRGTVSTGAKFEATIEQDRGAISIGGRILDPGPNKNLKSRFAVRLNVPNTYSKTKTETKQEQKDFEKKLKEDRFQVKWTDGKRVKEKIDTEVDAGSKEINGPGIAEVEIELSAYKGSKLVFSASPNSAILLTNGKVAPLYEGFGVSWSPDPVKDKDGKARLTIEVK